MASLFLTYGLHQTLSGLKIRRLAPSLSLISLGFIMINYIRNIFLLGVRIFDVGLFELITINEQYKYLQKFMSNRQVSCGKLINPHFVGVNVFIVFNYVAYVYLFMIDLKPSPYIVLLIVFHLLFILLLISMIRSILGDPGRVPIYWGFFAEESDNRKRRYCLLCHSFKPQRCHHCSTCQRCVLNMDHHCPWISNCVGFSNRKFFMLFLFYIILTLIFCLGCEIPLQVMELMKIFEGKQNLQPQTIVRSVALLTQLAFLIVIITFFKFHVELVLSNSSTLDNLERQRNPNAGPNVYDVGAYENFVQVFGTNPILWPLPVAPAEYQKGNGVVWAKNQ